ncbi:Imidazole glycerol phosphate synthase subunit hisH [Candidatus Desulfofervidus auxilii]|uniref:Imidazole glycerol phosphate synthase subunit HisH n=1 Tax=Desulfofervidus auxilii TaxID=1621989 RepID=A0A7V1P3V1_DESA2|nr:imidazole glycerol phosphate synthase subunit HisH [Candidatus Desulfofervidus auxilii]CAD7772715.1 MAG: Imidazole glycerol phosphate synthase subunit HisH [Candidatus Methanoperedenaceae archaeon GB37]CAD7777235.1 Imidazole glycerol phosphate synthase subunit HisH [Candidatus Methanoperedenaceae archaeon GB50]AMM41205.1 Imidazole glycerol phosphate synthase subunit hisH [Candidatus Desulfofervidus auxilii]CAD7778200.1 Imidazole glycerol phosphate synthase subunit HisH [Candidatus Methanoper
MIAIVNYRAGNLTSVQRALSYLGYESKITSNPSEILKAKRVIFPGVGAAGTAMEDLKKTGMGEALKEIYLRKIPLLGICLGTQVIFEYSEEDNTPCLGILSGTVKAFPYPLKDPEEGEILKVPHMGWNYVEFIKPHPVFVNIPPGAEFYFVHSYYPSPQCPEDIFGITDYGIKFSSVVASKSLVAVQFHPEKSGGPGLKILDNFCRWRPNDVE